MSSIAAPHRSHSLPHPALVLAALCAFLFFYGLNTGDLYRTEGLRAIIGAEFLRSGNWIVPTLYGEPLFTKPPGQYAAIALASWPFGGVTTWSARLPSALAATATVFLFYWYFSRQLGRRGGLLAAVILPTSVMWLDKAPSAEIDMLQLAWVSGAILFGLRALDAEEDRASACWWTLSLLCVAGGFLTKWTAPAFFYMTVVPLLWWRGRLRLLLRWPHLVAVAAAGVVCVAWMTTAIALTSWEVFRDTVSREGLMRISPSHHDRPYPWVETLTHPFRVLATTLPWSIFALFALRPGFANQWDERGQRLLQALHCWAWPSLLFWTLIPEHAVRHSSPLFPALAGLSAMVWLSWLRKSEALSSLVLRPWSLVLRPWSFLVGILVVWLMVKVAFVEYVIPHRCEKRSPQAKAQQLAALVPVDATLYLFKMKDEGIMFYYGRPVRRVASPLEIPSHGEPVYCILTEPEWQQWEGIRPGEAVGRLTDEQGDPMILVRAISAHTPHPSPLETGARGEKP